MFVGAILQSENEWKGLLQFQQPGRDVVLIHSIVFPNLLLSKGSLISGGGDSNLE